MVNKLQYGQTPPPSSISTEVQGFVRFSVAAARSARRILLRIYRKKNRRAWRKGRRGRKTM